MTALNTQRTATIARMTRDGNLISRAEAAAELRVTPSAVDHYARHGYLAAVLVDEIPGQHTTLFRLQDVERFKREWRRTDDPKRSALRSNWLDPDFVISLYRARGITERDAEKHGLSLDDMDAVYRNRVLRRAQLFASPKGRPKGSGRAVYHREWAEAAEFVRAELAIDYREKVELELLLPGDHPPTDQDVFLAVAERDFVEHPERWKDYPHAPGDLQALRLDFRKSAINRVRKAIKSLEKLETAIL